MDTQTKQELKIKLRQHGIFLKDIASECDCSLSLVSRIFSSDRMDYANVLETAALMLNEKAKKRRRVERLVAAA